MFKYILIITIIFINPALAKTYNLEYTVYAGGLKGLFANINIKIDKNNTYHIVSDIKTTGFISYLYPLIATYKTDGVIKKGKLYPLTYGYESKVRKKKRTRMVDYSDKKGFIDIQTFVLKSMLEVTKDKDCKDKSNIFMGSRNLTVSLKDKKEFSSAHDDYGIFKGTGIKCQTMIDTDDIEKKESSWFFKESQGALNTYFANINKEKTKLMVKVDMGSIGYGKIIAYLVGANVTE